MRRALISSPCRTWCRLIHTCAPLLSAAAAFTPTTPSSSSSATASSSPLAVLHEFASKKQYKEAANYAAQHMNWHTHSLLHHCTSPCEARDIILLLQRIYTALGRMDQVREVYHVGLRDLSASEDGEMVRSWPTLRAPATHTGTPADAAAPALGTALFEPSSSSSSSSRSCCWRRPSMLNTSFFNGYLEVLTQRKNYDAEEVIDVLHDMKMAHLEPDALTYNYLVEMHVRAGVSPKSLWEEMMSKSIQPLPCTLLTLMQRVLPTVPGDALFAVAVVKESLKCGSAVLGKRRLAELSLQWLRQGLANNNNNNNNNESSNTAQGEGASASPSSSSSSSGVLVSGAAAFSPEYVLWLMLELELRCVLDKASFTHYIQMQHLVELLLCCAKSSDGSTASQVLALMDRHVMGRTSDVLALMVWCYAQAQEVESALDTVELMARKGYLDHTDPLRRYVVESIRFTMGRHFLMALADNLGSVGLLDRAEAHLRARQQRGQLVSVHTLDVLVLAASKLGEERRAMALIGTYATQFGLQPRATSFNGLLLGCATHHGTTFHRLVYDAMGRAGVVPTSATFRILIRQAVQANSMDEAIFYLQEVQRFPGLRVEIEMLLPPLERAARAGDEEAVAQLSQFALQCDVGISDVVLHNAMRLLTEAGRCVDHIRGQLPLHDALRSRSKSGRQRVQSHISL